MLRRFNICKTVGKETFKEVPGQPVMRGWNNGSILESEINQA